ncbi:large ribosomal subunit protein mL39-like [Ornithodoros turicata]
MPSSRSRCILSYLNIVSKRFFTTATIREAKLSNQAVTKKRNVLFTEELNRQASIITRVEKIEVNYTGVPEKCTLIMNKHLSTPYDCARHIHENLCQRAAVAMVNGKVHDIHRPLTGDCELSFKFYKDEDPYLPNKAFWRTGSFVIGYLAERAFKDQFCVQLHSWPQPQVKSGSFVYDIDLGIENWEPRVDELDVLTFMGRKLTNQSHCFECIDVDASVALKIFEDNRYKVEQIPRIAAATSSGSTVTLYRLLDHVDISHGPMVGCLNHLYNFKVVAVHPIETSVGLMYRFQGLAIPKDFTISSFALSVICERARRMNYTGLPKRKFDEEESTAELQGLEGNENEHGITFKEPVASQHN